MKPPFSPLPFFLVTLLVGLSACSSETGVTPDAAAPADAADTGTDAPTTDIPIADIPTTDVPTTDVPTTDVPTTDVPRVDAPLVDAPTPTDACARPDIARIPERVDCSPRADSGVCPSGYDCLSFSGVVLQLFCGRPCRSDCDCPTGERCGSYSDKAGTHPLCVAST